MTTIPSPSLMQTIDTTSTERLLALARGKQPVCVVVGIQQNGLGVARALGRQGIPVVAISEQPSRVYEATRFAHVIACPDIRGESLISMLEEVGQLLGHGVLILTLDRSVLLVSEHRSRIEKWFTHSLPRDPVISRLMNKAQLDTFAHEQGFKVPRTFAVRCEDELQRCIGSFSFPCVLKPQIKTVAFVARSPQKAFFIRSAEELWLAWQQVAQWEPEVVIQEWIDGPDTNLVFCLFYFDRSGQPIASFTGRKLRQFIPRVGTACAAEPWADEYALNAGIRFFQAADYTGFGAIEFKVNSKGEYYLIEPTVGRTEHIFALAEANGVNLPVTGYRDMARLPPVPQRHSRRNVVYIDWRRDLRAARVLIEEGELTWPQWLRSIARPTQRGLFAWDDPGPFMRRCSERVTNNLAKTTARVRRAASQRLGA